MGEMDFRSGTVVSGATVTQDVISYSIIFWAFLSSIPARRAISLPDVDGTVLSMFGVAQGAYLVKKAATGMNS